GEFQMVQLWVNLPAKDKMSAPRYQAIENTRMPKVVLPGAGGLVEVIAGEYQGERGPASTFSPVHMMNAKLNAGGEAHFGFPAHYSTALLTIQGSATIQGHEVPQDHFILMANDGTDFIITASEDAIVLVLSGEPLNEPIAAYGPFVMNTQAEIIQALRDVEDGRFGVLEE
ncbi:MAG: pirin family protein, partial [Bacteroidota bacterium]